MARNLRIILVGFGILVLAVPLVPFLIPVNRFRLNIEEKTSAALGRKVRLGNLRLSLFRRSLAAEDLSISDDPSFSPSPFLTAKSLNVGVELLPLIFSKTLNVTGITIQNPKVMLIRNAVGQWNCSSVGVPSATAESRSVLPKPSDAASSSANLLIKKLELTDGQINVGSTNSPHRSTYDHVNILASDVSVATRFSVVVAADLPGGGNFKLDGNVGPLDRSDASLTPVNAQVDVRSLDLASTGFLSPSSGLGGVLDLYETLSSQNGEAETKGTAKLSKALLIAGGSPAPEPVAVEFSTKYDLRKNAGILSPSMFKIGNASAHLRRGTYQSSAEETVLDIKFDGRDMPAKDLESFLPALGVILPKGARLQGGTVNAMLNFTGPTNQIVATGNVGLFNAKLTGFDLGSKAPTVSSLTGIPAGKDLQIEKLTASLRMLPDGLHADRFIIVLPSTGSLDGSGSIDSKNNLNFKVQANLTAATADDASPVVIDLTGTYQLRSENPLLKLAMTGHKLPIDELQQRMTAAGIRLPNGAILKGGTLDIALNLTGLAKDLVITGPIQLSNTREIGFDLDRGFAA